MDIILGVLYTVLDVANQCSYWGGPWQESLAKRALTHMPWESISEFLISSAVSTTVLGLIILLLRDTIKSYLIKSIESLFARDLEELKVRLKRDEDNHANIRGFITTLRSDRDLAVQRRKMEAAETLMKMRGKIQALSLLVEFNKILKFDVIEREMKSEDMAHLFKTIIEPYNIKEFIEDYNKIDRTTCYIYLSDNTLKHFEVFSSLSTLAAMNIYYRSLGLKNKDSFIDPEKLTKNLLEVAPAAREGLEKYGASHAYYWVKFIDQKVLELIREEILGNDDLTTKAKSASDISVAANFAHLQMTEVIQNLTVPPEFLRNQTEETAGSAEPKR